MREDSFLIIVLISPQVESVLISCAISITHPEKPNLREFVFQKAEITRAAWASAIAVFRKTCKRKIIRSLNNINIKNLAWRKKCRKMLSFRRPSLTDAQNVICSSVELFRFARMIII